MKRIAIYFGSVLILTLIVLISMKIRRNVAIDGCLDKGGMWDHSHNECDCLSRPDSIQDFDNYWYAAWDNCQGEETLVKGKNVGQDISIQDAINNLNKRKALCKIKVLAIEGETVNIEIMNDQVLTEQMGSSGSYCYMAETVFTLTEIESISQVYIHMEEGSHASPGIYNRDDFKDLLKTGANNS